MAPSRPPLTKPSSFTQTTLNGSFTRRTSQTTISISDNTHRISKKPPPAKSKSKSAGPTASDRMLTDVLLSIKPLHLANIVSRQKNHEYRKYRLRDGVTRLWFYETGDGGGGRASITCVTSYLSTSLSIPLSALAVFLRFSASLPLYPFADIFPGISQLSQLPYAIRLVPCQPSPLASATRNSTPD